MQISQKILPSPNHFDPIGYQKENKTGLKGNLGKPLHLTLFLMDGKAIILSGGLFDSMNAKTAHGLVRGTDRYEIVGVIDEPLAGKDAGEVLEGKHSGTPIFESVESFLAAHPGGADYAILGIATGGGKLPRHMFPEMKTCIQAGISLVSGLHEFLSNEEELSSLAEKHNVSLIDVRKPKPRGDLHFWSGKIMEVKCPKIAVMGADCGIGKRTTARFLVEKLREEGINAQMIYTGQTGWLQGGVYGFIFDSTLNDFVSGELEHAIHNCYVNEKPDVIIVEGQAALRNPSGPCGSEFLVSGQMNGVILQYAPARKFYKGWESTGIPMPSPESEIALIKAYGVPTLGMSLNTKGLKTEEAKEHQETFTSQLGLPVVLPVEEGVEGLLPSIKSLITS